MDTRKELMRNLDRDAILNMMDDTNTPGIEKIKLAERNVFNGKLARQEFNVVHTYLFLNIFSFREIVSLKKKKIRKTRKKSSSIMIRVVVEVVIIIIKFIINN